jgi:hypothetical protein
VDRCDQRGETSGARVVAEERILDRAREKARPFCELEPVFGQPGLAAEPD